MKTTIGGKRLGDGSKVEAEQGQFPYSTHNLSKVFRSTMACGTLVPFICEPMLPGDTFEIDLEADCKTAPTVGPLFGSFKLQLDVFKVPIRLYQGRMLMNETKIGLDMTKVKLPQIEYWADVRQSNTAKQINSSSITSYLGVRGLGSSVGSVNIIPREFNAIPLIAYYEIYKNYYASKTEEEGVIIHTDVSPVVFERATIEGTAFTENWDVVIEYPDMGGSIPMDDLRIATKAIMTFNNLDEMQNFDENRFVLQNNELGWKKPIKNLATSITYNEINYIITYYLDEALDVSVQYSLIVLESSSIEGGLNLKRFPLTDLDDFLKYCLKETMSGGIKIDKNFQHQPYKSILEQYIEHDNFHSSISKTQEGLAIKTYQNDMFNGWINTEWIDGDNGVNEVTKIEVDEEGKIAINDIVLMSKIWDMLNGIAMAGGSFDEWQEAVYDVQRRKADTVPMYYGGMSKEVVFQEVISNSATENEPLGTLAGRGITTGDKKGGKVQIKADEHCFMIGIVSLTPRLNYSTGNKWFNRLETLDDFHKPQLDRIGFQNLITDEMAWWDTQVNPTGLDGEDWEVIYKSAGKVPAWLSYMTNINESYGLFADDEQEWMVLNRNYEKEVIGDENSRTMQIKDLTMYIDPTKFNYPFAQVDLSSQNFWVQIKTDVKARRKMSASIMPKL